MIDLTFYGKPSHSYEYLKAKILDDLKLAGIHSNVNEISDLDKIMKEEISSIPSIKVANKLFYIGKENVKIFADRVSSFILSENTNVQKNTLIVPIDFSETSLQSLKYAAELQNSINAKLHILNVFHPAPQSTEYQLDQLDALIVAREVKLNKITNEIFQSKNNIQENVVSGFAASKIVEISDKNENGLICMGFNNDQEFHKKLFGSVSLSVLNNSKNPLLLLPRGTNFKSWNKVIYCSGNPAQDAIALPQLIRLINQFKSELHFVHVDNDPHYSHVELLNLAKRLYPSERIFYHLLEGNAFTKRINDFAGSIDADLIIMKKRNLSKIESLFSKSLTKQQALKTQLPLLILNK